MKMNKKEILQRNWIRFEDELRLGGDINYQFLLIQLHKDICRSDRLV